MKLSGWRLLLAAAAVGVSAAVPSHAGTITFDGVPPTLFSNSSISVDGFRFTSDGFGFSGVDNASAFAAFGNAPANADGNFLFMLNSDGMIMDKEDGSQFRLQAFDTSFIAPVGGVGPDVFAGQLVVFGVDAGGFDFEVFEFDPSDANGNFNFQHIVLSNLATKSWNHYEFYSCVYDAAFNCDFSSAQAVQPQFALDNVYIPEPASLALAMAALAVTGAIRRRGLR